MGIQYDIFERLTDGSLHWRACARSKFQASVALAGMAETTVNEMFAIDPATQEIIARVNQAGAQGAD